MLKKSEIKAYNKALDRKGFKKTLCYAPFKSLRFSQSGNIISCCYNRGYILGKYPKNSIKEIWQGEKIKKIIRNIRQNKLNLGCDLCKNSIKDKAYNLTGASHYDCLKAYKVKKYLAMLDFEISNKCNLECIMCTGENSSSIRENREKLPNLNSVYDKHFVEQIKEFIPHIEEARFTGGEPFLINLYYDIWELIIKYNPKTNIIIVTNASILN